MPDLYLCNECGQTTCIQKHGCFDTRAPSYCPFCGSHDTLEPVRSSFMGFRATCFAAYDKLLVSLTYEEWALNKNGEKEAEETFIGYLRAITTPE